MNKENNSVDIELSSTESKIMNDFHNHITCDDSSINTQKMKNKIEKIGEILLTSMDADGHENGYDIQLLRAVSEKVNIPVIASGGAGTLDHFREAVEEGMADAVLAASIFHFGTYNIRDVKDYLNSCGVPVRPINDSAS